MFTAQSVRAQKCDTSRPDKWRGGGREGIVFCVLIQGPLNCLLCLCALLRASCCFLAAKVICIALVTFKKV